MSMNRALAEVARHVPPALVEPAALARARAVAASLPEIFDWWIFEARLGGADRRVDVLGCISAAEDGRAALASFLTEGRDVPLLRPARAALAAWAAAGALAEQVPLLWLEYDLFEEGPRGPLVYACVDAAYPSGLRARVPEPAELARLVASFAGAPDGVAALESCARELPDGAHFLHVGSLRPRGRNELRVVVVMTPRQAPEWLDTMGWPGDRGGLSRLLALVGKEQRRISLQLDLGAAVGPAIAVEFFQRAAGSPWRAFFDRLLAAQLCTAHEREAALGWIGDELSWADSQALVVDRQLDVKLVLDADGKLTAKAYLAVHPHDPMVRG